MALITTVIPTFRRPLMLERAIESVLAQTFVDLQINVYDDASGDETAAVVQSISRRDPRVNYFCHPKRLGMMANFDFGVAKVSSPYFHIMSDDDLLLPDFFQTGIRELQRYPEAMLFIGRLVIAQPDGYVFRVTGSKWTMEGLEFPPSTFVKLAEGDTWTSMIFRRDVLDTVGTLDPEIGPAGDHDFELRVAALYPAVISRSLCAIFCIHPASSSVSRPLTHLLKGIPRIVRNVNQIIDRGVSEQRISIEAGHTMRRVLITGLRRQLATMALVAALKGQPESIVAAVDFLAQEHGFSRRAMLLKVLTNSTFSRSLLSTAYRMSRLPSRVWRNYKYSQVVTLVSSAFGRAAEPG
jgi:hypothetical protein